ncbi:transposase [Streptomyces sp. NPDC058326]|uniref:transposase n=1 Tax=Streptomyces sp. NPDC058326 TaxID=3346447 RepID=UPI0036EB7DA8
MRRGDVSDAEWNGCGRFLPVSNRRCGRWRDHRQVIDGILHRVRTGVQWRDGPLGPSPHPDIPAVGGRSSPRKASDVRACRGELGAGGRRVGLGWSRISLGR